MNFDTQKTPNGTQTLVPGVKPVTDRDRLDALARQPMKPTKRQKPLDIGLVDEESRKQTDLIDLVRRVSR